MEVLCFCFTCFIVWGGFTVVELWTVILWSVWVGLMIERAIHKFSCGYSCIGGGAPRIEMILAITSQGKLISNMSLN